MTALIRTCYTDVSTRPWDPFPAGRISFSASPWCGCVLRTCLSFSWLGNVFIKLTFGGLSCWLQTRWAASRLCPLTAPSLSVDSHGLCSEMRCPLMLTADLASLSRLNRLSWRPPGVLQDWSRAARLDSELPTWSCLSLVPGSDMGVHPDGHRHRSRRAVPTRCGPHDVCRPSACSPRASPSVPPSQAHSPLSKF